MVALNFMTTMSIIQFSRQLIYVNTFTLDMRLLFLFNQLC